MPLGAVPRQQRGIDKRERLYRAALEEFEAHGERAARIERVVAETGLGWGTFFHYFPRKQDVLLLAAIEVQTAMEAAAADREAVPGAAVRDILQAAYRCLATPLHGPRVHLLAIREVLANAIRYDQMLGDRDPFFVHAARLLALGQQRGEVRADVEAGLLARILNSTMLVMCSRVGVPGAVGLPRDQDLPSLAEVTFDVAWAGIESGAAARG